MCLLPCSVCLQPRGDVGHSLLCSECAPLSQEAKSARYAEAREMEMVRREQCGLLELLPPLPERLSAGLAESVS